MSILFLVAALLLLCNCTFSSSVTFHQNGHLYQIDHAKLALKKGSTIVCTKCSDGILLLVISNEKRTVLQVPKVSKHKITKSLFMVATGYSFDAMALIKTVKAVAVDYKNSFSEDIPVKYLCEVLAKPLHDRTKKSGRRLMATEAVFVEYSLRGYDSDDTSDQYQILTIDVEGSFRAYKALCIGGKYSNDIMEKISEIESKTSLQSLTVQDVLKCLSHPLYKFFNEKLSSSSSNVDVFSLRDSFDVECYKGVADKSTGQLNWKQIDSML